MKKLASPLTRITRSVSKPETHSRLMLLALCISAITLLTTRASAQIIWDGDTGIDWTTGTNWIGDIEPGALDDVLINNGALGSQPELSAGNDRTVLSTTIEAGSLSINAILTSPVTISGTGVLNVFTLGNVVGATTVESGGTLALLNGAAFSSQTTVNTGGVLDFRSTSTNTVAANITLDGGEANYINASNVWQAVSGALTVSSDSVINLAAVGATSNAGLFLDGGLHGPSTSNLTVDSNTNNLGLILRNSSSTFDGTITVLAGGSGRGLALGDTGNSLENASFTINGTLELGNSSAGMGWGLGGALNNTTASIGALNGSGVVVANMNVATARTLSVGNLNEDSNFSGSINAGVNSTLSLVKTGSGTQILSGTNTYTGTTTINDGTLQFATRNSLYNGNSVDWTAANISVQSGATLLLNVGGLNNFDETDVSTLLTNLTGLNGTATEGFAGDSFIAFDTTDAFAPFTITDNIADSSDGALGITKLGSGILELSGTSTYTGLTTVNEGTLLVSSNGALGLAAGGTTVADGATLELNGGLEIADDLTITGTGVLGAGAIVNSGDNTIAGVITVDTGTSATINAAGGTLTLTGGIVKDAAELTLTGGGIINVDSEISGISPNSDLIVNGVTANLNAANTYNGPTYIRSTLLDTGILNANVANALPTLNGRTDVIMDDSGTGGSQLNLGFNQSVSSLTSNRTGTESSLVNLDVNTLTIGNTNGTTETFSGVISGTGGIIKDGDSTQILSGKNTYTGTTQIDGGTLQAAVGTDGQAFGSLSAVVLADDATALLDLNDTNQTIGSLEGGGLVGGNVALGSGTLTTGGDDSSTTFSGEIGGTGSLVKTGSGTFTLDNSNSYTGATTINEGTLEVLLVDGALGIGAAGTTVANGATLLLNASTYSTAEELTITGTGDGGTGALANSGISTFAGQINVLNGATINAGGGDLTLTGGIVKNATTLTLTGGGNIIIDGVISGASLNSDLIVDGVTVELNNANTYNGPTYIRSTVTDAGILNANAANALPTLNGRTHVIMDDSGTGASELNLIGGFDQSVASLSSSTTGLESSLVNLDVNTLTIGSASASPTTFAGIISGTGPDALIKDGVSVQILSGENTYTGTTLINAGTLQAGAAANGQAFGDLSAVTLANVAGATLALNNFDQTIGSLAGGGATGGSVTLGNATLTTGGDNTDTIFAGIISGLGGGLTKEGTGTFTLSGTNTYTGATTINDGTLELTSTGSTAAGSTVAVNTGGTLSGLGTVNGNATLTGNGIINFGATGNIAGTLGVTGGNWNGLGSVTGVVTSSSGTFTIGSLANLTATGGLNVTGGTIVGDVDSTITGSINYTSNQLSTFDGVIAGLTSTVTVNNNGTLGAGLVLTNTNTYGGLTTVTSGVLAVEGVGATIGNNANAIVSNLGTLALSDVTITQDIQITGSGSTNFTNSGGPLGAINAYGLLPTTSTITGNITLSGDASIVAEAGNTLNLDGDVDKNGVTLTLTGGGTINVNGEITGILDNSDLHVDGATVNLNAGNSYNGPTFIFNGGILNTDAAGALPSPIRTALTMDALGSSGSSQLNLVAGPGGFDQVIASLAGPDSTSVVNLNDNTLTIGTASGTTDFLGVITGTGSLIKDGESIQILSGLNDYSGSTTITDGTLQIDGEIVSDVTIEGPGTLSGDGTINASVTLTDDGFIDLGTNGLITGTLEVTAPGGSWIGDGEVEGTVTVSSGLFTIGSGANLTASSLIGVEVINAASIAAADATGTITGSLTYMSSALSTFQGVIAGNSDVTVDNESLIPGAGGGLILSGINTYTGTTTVTSGYLEVTGAGTLGNDANDVFVLNTGTLALTGDASINQDIEIEGTGTENFGASPPVYGALRADGLTESTVFGLVTLTGDASIVATAGSILNLAEGFDNDGLNATLTGGGTINVDGEISGVSLNSDLIVDGATVNLNAGNTYNGPTSIVNAGILNTNAVGALPLAILRTALTMDDSGSGSSELNLIGGFDQEIASLEGPDSSSSVNLNGNTLTIGTTGGSTDFAGVISGALGTGGITKDGTSTQIFSGLNTYSGATTVNEGTLQAGVLTQAFGIGSAVTVNTDGTLDLNDLDQTIGSLAGDPGGSVTLGTATLTTGGNDDSTEFTGVISGDVGGGITKVGTGIFTLSGINTYTGATNVNEGILQAGAAADGQAFGDRSAVTLLDVTGVALDLNDFSQTIGSLEGGGLDGGNVTLGDGTLTIGTTGGSTDFAGVISGTGGITKDLASTQILSGLNTYTGNTLVSAGILRAGVATSAFGIGSAVTVNSGGTLDLNDFDQTIGSLAGDPGGSVTLGTATLTTGGNDSSTLFNGVISESGALIKVGSGTFTLAGSNTYTGATTVSSGVLQVDVNNALGTAAAGTTVEDGAALVLNGVTYTTPEGLTINGTGILGGGALVNVGTSTYAGTITADTDSTINAGGGELTLTGGLVKNGINLTLTGGGTINVNSVISGALASSDLFVDGVTTNLNGANTYNGATYIRNNGIINANVLNAMPTLINRSALIMDDQGTGSSVFNLGFSQSIASLDGLDSTSSVDLDIYTLTIGTTGGSTEFTGVISGAGNLTKDGASIQVLSASNEYEGLTTVTAGTLVLSDVERLHDDSDLTITGGTLTFVDVETVDIFEQTGGILDFDVDHSGVPLLNCLLIAGVDNLIATTADLGGTINVNKELLSAEFQRGERAVLIDTTAIAGITGTPDSFTHGYTDRMFLVVDTSTIDTLTPLGAADTVSLLGTGITGQNGNLANIAGLNANQKAIANAINTNINLNGNILDTSVEMDQIAIFALGDCNSAPGANLNILSPESYAGFSDYGVQTIKSYTTNALSMPAFSRDGTARSIRIPVGTASEPMVSSGLGDSVTSVFAGYSHYSTGTESSINGADYDISSNGGILGVRHEVNRLTLGGFFAVDEGDVNSATLNSDVDAFLFGAIASYMVKPEMNLMVTGGITYGSYDFSGTRRSLGLVTFDDVGSDVLDIHAAIEGDAYSTDKIRVTPFLGFHYINSKTEAFTETGLGALTVAAHDYDAFFTEIGVKSEYQLNEKISLNGNLSFTHNLSGSDKNIGASLGGTPFAVSSPGLGDDILTIGLGAQFQVTEAIRLGINYRAEFNTDAEAANGLSIGGSYSF